MVGSYEYPDFPMTENVYGVKPGSHIPGAVLHRYLTDFAHKFGVYERLQFSTKVNEVEPALPPSTTDSEPRSGWKLSVSTPSGPRTLATAKLVLATGLTSTPNFPQYPGASAFGKPLFHAKDFCQRAPELERQQQRDIGSAVVVVGGAKSAYDVAHALVENAKGAVDLVVRPDGRGPVWIAPPYVTPLRRRLDTLLGVRALTWFSPCPWGGEDGYPRVRAFLHGTAVGRWIVDAFWRVLEGDVLGANRYDSHPELKKLKPWNAAFWIGTGLSILNYDTSLFDMVREGKIRVHVDKVERLEPGKVVLVSGEVLEADAMVCATGWKKESSIKFTGLGKVGLGLADAVEDKEMVKLNEKADSEILSLFPRLKDQPELRFKAKETDPLRYYRFMVPSAMVESKNLAFAGMVSTINTAVCATVQGIWIAAFLDGKLDRLADTPEEIEHEIMLHTQWGKWRHPTGYGASLPDLVFDGLPYVDMLLRDMGLKTHRKPSMIKELLEPYTPPDFNGVLDEWLAEHPVEA